jgi:flagellar hook-length control protein FliK
MIFFPLNAQAATAIISEIPITAAGAETDLPFLEIFQKIIPSQKTEEMRTEETRKETPDTSKEEKTKDAIDLIINENVLSELSTLFSVPPSILEKIAEEIKKDYDDGVFSLPAKTNDFERDYVKPLATVLAQKLSKITDIEFSQTLNKISETIKQEFPLKEVEIKKEVVESTPREIESVKKVEKTVQKSGGNKRENVQTLSDPSGALIKKESPTVVLSEFKTQPLKSQDILNQITSQIKFAKYTLGADKSVVKISLKPENLGEIELKIHSADGEVKALFVARNENVKAIIESGFNELKDSLAERGLEVSQLSVEVETGGEKRFSDNAAPNKKTIKTIIKDFKDYKNYFERLEDSIINFIA